MKKEKSPDSMAAFTSGYIMGSLTHMKDIAKIKKIESINIEETHMTFDSGIKLRITVEPIE